MTKAKLVIDIGGTKTLAARVDGQEVTHSAEAPTPRSGDPDDIVALAHSLAEPFAKDTEALIAAVTGGVNAKGEWSALNSDTLNIPNNYPLTERLQQTFGRKALALNDAQAAAFGEYAYGAAALEDCVYLTVSTGVGGGIIANGKLLKGQNGLAGHFGIMPFFGDQPAESQISGQWVARKAEKAGHQTDARLVFEEAARGAAWAEKIVDQSAHNFAKLLTSLALALDPAVFVIGGGIGLSPIYLERVKHHLSQTDLPIGDLRLAKLGKFAPVIGAAAYFDHNQKLVTFNNRGEPCQNSNPNSKDYC